MAETRRPRWRVLVLATICGGLLAACGGGDGDADVAAGEELFDANCARCHGAEATGTQMGPPLVDEIYEPSHHGDQAFHSAVANGVQPHHWEFGPMPAVPSLGQDEVDAIIAYVRDLQRDAGIE